MNTLFRRVSRQTSSYLCIQTPVGGYHISEKTDRHFRRLPLNKSKALAVAEKSDADFADTVKRMLDAAQLNGDARLLLTDKGRF